MKQWKWIALMTVLLCLAGGMALAENQYYVVNAPVEIRAAEPVVLTLDAQEGWMWNITDNTDVTAWLVKEDGSPAFADAEGIATAKLVYGPVENEESEVAVALEVTIDAARISGFTANGSYDLYVMPTGKSTIWVCSGNHGQYQDSRELAGSVVIPQVSVEGKLTANAGKELEVTNGTVQIVLSLNEIDDSKIDASQAQISLLPGDGYKLYEVQFEEGTLADTWTDGKADYTMGNITGNFSPQGGDGNGHYDFRIGINGIRYNGLPLSEAIVRTDFYSFGRTFLTEGGSLILNSEPVWTSEADIPVICDVYPDTVTATWPIAFDASKLTENDVNVTLISTYGDELVLEPGKDYVVTASVSRTDVTLNYIYWAYAPVYTTMRVSVNTENTTWNELMYKPAASFSHDFAIGSVYIYSVMSGGPSGTQAWTFFGLNNLKDSHQVYMDATYTLTAADADGNVFFYGEDENGKGMKVEKEADAVAFNCDAECNVHLEGDTVYYTRLFDQTEDKEIDGETITFTKNYYNCESLLRSVDSLVDVELAPGYTIGENWEDHLKWPWQTFVDVGYKGGSK
ncbi:MAG: hypothetical protein IJ246_12400 [Clostridia bacterium]|nr:hypothetical protein [Clostridia bacterium]